MVTFFKKTLIPKDARSTKTDQTVLSDLYDLARYIDDDLRNLREALQTRGKEDVRGALKEIVGWAQAGLDEMAALDVLSTKPKKKRAPKSEG